MPETDRQPEGRPVPLKWVIPSELQALYANHASFVAYSDFMTSLPDPHYRLRMPIRVVVDQDDDHYLVGDDVFMRYGVGSTVAEAKLDYSYALLDYYDELREDPDKLSPDLSRDLELLQGRITVTQS